MWDDLTILWNDPTIDWNDLTWNDLTMERNDRIPLPLWVMAALELILSFIFADLAKDVKSVAGFFAFLPILSRTE